MKKKEKEIHVFLVLVIDKYFKFPYSTMVTMKQKGYRSIPARNDR